MADLLSGLGAPQGEADKRHYVYSGGEVVARLEAELVTAGLPLVVRKRGTS